MDDTPHNNLSVCSTRGNDDRREPDCDDAVRDEEERLFSPWSPDTPDAWDPDEDELDETAFDL